jgi:hypothetical protein
MSRRPFGWIVVGSMALACAIACNGGSAPASSQGLFGWEPPPPGEYENPGSSREPPGSSLDTPGPGRDNPGPGESNASPGTTSGGCVPCNSTLACGMASQSADIALTEEGGGCDLIVEGVALDVSCDGTISYGGDTIGTITPQGGGSYELCVNAMNDSSDGGSSTTPECATCQLIPGVPAEDAGLPQQPSSPGSTIIGEEEDAGED